MATTFLIPQDRIARRPLAEWAAELTTRVHAAQRGARRTHELADQLGSVGNMAGLIAASRGDMAKAWSLTERQLWWHGRQARRSRDATVTAYALQPWINLGRLEALTGKWQAALARLDGLTTFPLAERLEMGCVQFSGSAWRALVPSRERFLEFLETVFISDSLKAMLLNRRFELVHPFVARFSGIEGEMRWMCEEACVVAECQAGEPAAAAARALAAARQANGWPRAVFRLRAAEAYACADMRDAAVPILEQLAGVIVQLGAEHKNTPQLITIIARLGAVCREAGLDHATHAVAADVLGLARTAGDEPVMIEMLRLLAATAPAAERQAWADAAAGVEQTTEYTRYRRGGSPPANPMITELYERLDEAFSN